MKERFSVGVEIPFPGGIITTPSSMSSDEVDRLNEAFEHEFKKPQGVWVAYYYDRSDLVIFNDELEALRYAMDNKYDGVVFWGFGKNWQEAINNG